MNTLSVFVAIAGLIIGLGAVAVIDVMGFLGRKSEYWAETTIRSHKVTKPLIWFGIFLVLIGHLLMVERGMLAGFDSMLRFAVIVLLIMNGSYLSFVISPELLRRESEGSAREILPKSMQKKIAMSFIISVFSWWLLVYLFISHLL